MLFGTLVAETILASAHVRAHRKAGHMDASDLIKALQNTLRGGGRPHMGRGPYDKLTRMGQDRVRPRRQGAFFRTGRPIQPTAPSARRRQECAEGLEWERSA